MKSYYFFTWYLHKLKLLKYIVKKVKPISVKFDSNSWVCGLKIKKCTT